MVQQRIIQLYQQKNIDDVVKGLGQSEVDYDWSTYFPFDFNDNGTIDLYDLVFLNDAISTADNEGVPTVQKVSDAFGKTELTEGSGWGAYSYLDLNNDGVIDAFDLVLL